MDKKKIAKKIVEEIVGDLTDRSGLEDEWENIDDDTLEEILEKWKNIVIMNMTKQEKPLSTLDFTVDELTLLWRRTRDLSKREDIHISEGYQEAYKKLCVALETLLQYYSI